LQGIGAVDRNDAMSESRYGETNSENVASDLSRAKGTPNLRPQESRQERQAMMADSIN
jgi:hypothetical protein